MKRLDCCWKFGVFFLACAALLGAEEPADKPESRVLRHGGLDRTYLIQMPKGTSRGKHPVILLLHPSARAIAPYWAIWHN